ncbi:peptidase M23 [Bacillus sp. MUM 116]|uniref:M23 family metallopeptidase n=1 Tax=Bacillus sp. MUM 116 TaxID=1678002 RepID=UPI0008F572FF|nr:M23 family metallopeptidase [Bacillus sp. MUM 116]OIK17048.1 peptidase M23 [Bacillus sp. MUM 116]
MARSTPDEIRKRINKRKKELGSQGGNPDRQLAWPGDEEKYGFNSITSNGSGPDDGGHPLFRMEVFIFKILASACLFLVVAILFRNQTATFDQARNLVRTSMDKDFKFAFVSQWYEEKFGKPLALLPFNEPKKEKQSKTASAEKPFDIPATGKVLENFQKNGQGIMIETANGASVEAINGGNVSFAGVKAGLGKTVIIQHADGTETWYGNLADIKVKLWDYVEKRKVVGNVSSSEEKSKGKYYFAIKKGDEFIDPVQVIRFE